MSDPDRQLRLTEGQRRHIRLALEGLVRGAEERLALWPRTGLQGDEGEAARAALEGMLRSAREAAAAVLGEPLAVTTPDPARSLASWATAWWSTVLNCRPAALQAYGDIEAETAEALAPVIEDLADRLLRLRTVAEGTESLP